VTDTSKTIWVIGKKGPDDEDYELWVNDEVEEGGDAMGILGARPAGFGRTA